MRERISDHLLQKVCTELHLVSSSFDQLNSLNHIVTLCCEEFLEQSCDMFRTVFNLGGPRLGVCTIRSLAGGGRLRDAFGPDKDSNDIAADSFLALLQHFSFLRLVR